ncbi:ThuA domain-containing protein [Kitasatospora phosalacinea]|uniref:ThuA domain-containing protein n=1 Tax=Kitasatospora phosalacinea TaxID=2065 RepID=UPI00052705DE|nr:ThuA domain-containing protein [Kitasatospora phosalacinea]
MQPAPDGSRLGDVLVYTRTTAYRHDSIPAGVAAMRELGEEHGFTIEPSEDPSVFTPASLNGRSAVVFLSTSGEVLTDAGRNALRHWVDAGGGFMGVHSAACTEYGWPYYGELIGARFAGHPPVQTGVVVVEDAAHPSTAHLGSRWAWQDEWYDFRSNPRPGVRVLASADENSYTGGAMGPDHPLAWCRDQERGRVFYTALGHCASSYSDAAFRTHLLGGLSWVSTDGIRTE